MRLPRLSELIQETTQATTPAEFDEVRRKAEEELDDKEIGDFLEVWYGERREAGF